MLYEPLIIKNIPYRIYVGRSQSFRQHWHSEMELLICLEGGMQICTESREVWLNAGDAVLLPGYEAHAIGKTADNTRRLAVVFGYALLGKEYHTIRNRYIHIRADREIPEPLRQAVDSILAAVEKKQEWKLRGSLFYLAAYLKESSAPESVPNADRQGRLHRLEGIYPVLEYVKNNYHSRITIDQAAELSGYDTTYFCKQFKNIIGMPFHQYLNRYRINVACQLLEDPKLSVATIADMTGFSSSKSFCRSFKEQTGMTATQYQALRPDEKHISWLL